ncbi:LysR substrate-binding domain-containing protein [Natroniella sulfidigena]|uniref:LysR substrate-binding domain-containing protein n=1 Tax=Natroniella sulfidigena TaxID=723921 RepID=UPI00200AD50D|nr:LysR substrate-binding domain-containing protein [Natroniella sulfidigena]MCK8816100.1 LysR substrate-binding domain-containing protein [Natroniella sulfidigena]
MKIYHFEIFITVVRAKSFSKAAKLLYLSQPAVSKHIKSMEEYYGTELFNRSNQGVTLNPAGKLVYDYAQKILKVHDELDQKIDNYLHPEERDLTVGASITPGGYLLPCTLWAFKDKHPQINIKLKVDYSKTILEKVMNNQLALGIIEGNIPANCDLNTELIITDQLKIITAPQEEKEQAISITELKKLPLILPSQDFYIRKKFEQFLADHNLNLNQLNIVAEMESISAIKSAVEANLGVSILSYSSIKKAAYQNTISIIDFKEDLIDQLRLDITLIHNNSLNQPSIITKFISFLTLQHKHTFC